MVNNRYYKNRKITIGDYTLEVTTGMTVYHASKRGHVKLDSFMNYKIGKLSVILPNDKTVMIIFTKEGLKLDEPTIQKSEELKE